jgi:hypothetical protein
MTTDGMGSEETRVKECLQRGKSSHPKPDAQVAHVSVRFVGQVYVVEAFQANFVDETDKA